MTYLKRTNTAQKRSKAVRAAIFLFLIALLGIDYLFPGFYPALFYPISGVVWKGENSMSRSFFRMTGIFRSKISLSGENETLKREISANQSSLLLLDILQRENEDLKALLGRFPEQKIVLSVVLARPPVSPYDTLVIDIGKNHGVAVGDRVYAEGDVLIGEIAEAYARESKVSLFSTPGRKISVSFADLDMRFEAIGRGGGNYKAFVPTESGIKEGDLVISDATLGTRSMGVVESVTADKSGSFSSILFKSPINVQSLRYVEVAVQENER